jgi:hypothetical protein
MVIRSSACALKESADAEKKMSVASVIEMVFFIVFFSNLSTASTDTRLDRIQNT